MFPRISVPNVLRSNLTHSNTNLKEICMEERINQYKEFVRTCQERKLIIGQGNPLSDILFVGCEPNQTEEEYKKFKNHIANCLKEEKGMTFNNLWGPINKSGKKEGWTWNKYQKIIDVVYPNRPHEHGMLDFEDMAFCTELNNVLGPHSKDVDKSTIPLKRQLFKESDFIQSFPVVVLACGSYIVNQGDNRQIDDTFSVHYVEQENSDAKQEFWIHKSNDSNTPKLVIHTRQLSGAITNDLLQAIGAQIQKFLISIGKLSK